MVTVFSLHGVSVPLGGRVLVGDSPCSVSRSPSNRAFSSSCAADSGPASPSSACAGALAGSAARPRVLFSEYDLVGRVIFAC